MDGTLPRLQESTPEHPATVVATSREPPVTVLPATVSTTSGKSEESAVAIPISNRERFMIASTLLGLPRTGETKVMHWINGITEMDRFAKELNGFVFVFGQFPSQIHPYPA